MSVVDQAPVTSSAVLPDPSLGPAAIVSTIRNEFQNSDPTKQTLRIAYGLTGDGVYAFSFALNDLPELSALVTGYPYVELVDVGFDLGVGSPGSKFAAGMTFVQPHERPSYTDINACPSRKVYHYGQNTTESASFKFEFNQQLTRQLIPSPIHAKIPFILVRIDCSEYDSLAPIFHLTFITRGERQVIVSKDVAVTGVSKSFPAPAPRTSA